ncbi:uncharacterized protein [Panulirus ornatus]|uniref:uncharacterized protein n=1 Tax=Panulirus ornatus TaxID=150431 RepID=UPI003A86A853
MMALGGNVDSPYSPTTSDRSVKRLFKRTGLKWSMIQPFLSRSCRNMPHNGGEGLLDKLHVPWWEIMLFFLTTLVAPHCVTAQQTPTVGVVVETTSPKVATAAVVVVKEVLTPLSRAIGLHLRVIHAAPLQTTLDSLTAELSGVEGVLSLGGCGRGGEKVPPGLANEIRLPILHILLGECVGAPDLPDVIPVYKFKGVMGEDCLHTLVWRWMRRLLEDEARGLLTRTTFCSPGNITHMILRRLSRGQPHS